MMPSSMYGLFIAYAVALSAANVIPTTTSTCAPRNESCVLSISPLEDPLPYYFPPLEDADTPALFPMPKCHGLTLEEATIDQLQDAMSRGVLTSEKLVGCFLWRILQVDGYIK